MLKSEAKSEVANEQDQTVSSSDETPVTCEEPNSLEGTEIKAKEDKTLLEKLESSESLDSKVQETDQDDDDDEDGEHGEDEDDEDDDSECLTVSSGDDTIDEGKRFK